MIHETYEKKPSANEVKERRTASRADGLDIQARAELRLGDLSKVTAYNAPLECNTTETFLKPVEEQCARKSEKKT